MLLTRAIELGHPLGSEPPRITLFIKAQLPINQHECIFDDELAIALQDLIKECHFDTATAIIEHNRGPVTSSAYFVNIARERRLTTAKESTLCRTCGGQVILHIDNPVAHKPSEIFLKSIEGMTTQI